MVAKRLHEISSTEMQPKMKKKVEKKATKKNNSARVHIYFEEQSVEVGVTNISAALYSQCKKFPFSNVTHQQSDV